MANVISVMNMLDIYIDAGTAGGRTKMKTAPTLLMPWVI
ncbi:Uncharacterized protein YR821_3020 [Yersinia ruckeri]|uniref:Uncharacterized protein n=1 Tax=Yersinia ruckeri TaxID=29486 RepID=A0A0A8VKF5_YERRU|nr:hypothetical protein yruck0001_2960 [Yersinia ruckeri ATCC 29473]QTD77936.1 Uncharacterized protein YR821_3020 [Yersinia ruckeri]CEK28853.1 hypothetical protein CSF007_15655 [Yersinia ruckeri]